MTCTDIRKLVYNSSFSPHDACAVGRCPHCNEVIDQWRSSKKCQCCKEPIAWNCSELSADERTEANKEAQVEEKEHNKKIKPCPICGKSVSFPEIQIVGGDKPSVYLEVCCFHCGIKLTEILFKRTVQSINEANEKLIKTWNTRWKDEPT